MQIIPDQIYGAGDFSTVEQQRDDLPDEAYPIVIVAVFAALSKVDDHPSAGKSFTLIKQANGQDDSSFIDQLKGAVERQIENAVAAEGVFKKLAVENANEDCKRILRPLLASGPKELAEMIQACSAVGSQAYQMEALAAALQKAKTGNCFNCGKPGHLKAECRAPGGGQHEGENGGIAKPKSLCPKCKKGYHWANQCRYGASSKVVSKN